MRHTEMPAARMTQGELEQTCILTGGDPFANGAKVTPCVLSAPSSLAGMKPELAGVPEPLAKEALRLAGTKLSVKTKVVKREADLFE